MKNRKTYTAPEAAIVDGSAWMMGTGVGINDSFGDEVVIEFGKKGSFDDREEDSPRPRATSVWE